MRIYSGLCKFSFAADLSPRHFPWITWSFTYSSLLSLRRVSMAWSAQLMAMIAESNWSKMHLGTSWHVFSWVQQILLRKHYGDHATGKWRISRLKFPKQAGPKDLSLRFGKDIKTLETLEVMRPYAAMLSKCFQPSWRLCNSLSSMPKSVQTWLLVPWLVPQPPGQMQHAGVLHLFASACICLLQQMRCAHGKMFLDQTHYHYVYVLHPSLLFCSICML